MVICFFFLISQANRKIKALINTLKPSERKISFVLHEPDNESEGSSNTTVTMQGEENNNLVNSSKSKTLSLSFCRKMELFNFVQGLQQRRPMATVRPFLLRRGTTTAPAGGSFKRRSLKLRRGTKEGKDIETDCKLIELLVTLFHRKLI